MDHRYRKERQGLIELDTIPERRLREEEEVLIDEYAAEAIRRLVPPTLFNELQGWARSYYKLEKHIEAILAYNKPKLPEPTNVAWNTTKQHVLNEFRRFGRVTSLSYKDFDSVKWVRSSAAGYGYVGRKFDDDNYARAKRTAITIAKRLDLDRNYGPEAILESTPDVAFTRTQLSQLKVKTKVRNVWGEAFHYVLLEGLFADPLIDHFKALDTFYFIGSDPLFSVPSLIEEIVKAKDYVYMFDWSAFDASVQEWEIRFAFQCLSSLLLFPSNREAQIWRFVTELFIYRKIASPNGVLYLKTQGIPSGSCFTNIIGSITNYVRIQYIFYRLTSRYATVYTHGDDSLVGVNTDQFVQMGAIDQVCNEHLWKINIAKSAVSPRSEGVTFLSRSVRESQNYREEMVCLRMLMYPEYRVTQGNISALRAKSIYRDAGINSQYLWNIFMYLKDIYGVAESLPFHLTVWDPVEFEARRLPASELL